MIPAIAFFGVLLLVIALLIVFTPEDADDDEGLWNWNDGPTNWMDDE